MNFNNSPLLLYVGRANDCIKFRACRREGREGETVGVKKKRGKRNRGRKKTKGSARRRSTRVVGDSRIMCKFM